MKNIIIDTIGLLVLFAFFYMVLMAEPALTKMIIDWKNPPV
jgi:hypothetical protein